MCITACGNFAIVGMTTGHLEIFNMQSGLHRGVIGKGKGKGDVIITAVAYLRYYSNLLSKVNEQV